jgi:two-component system phosphate regulon sensor histidine kinase PhoR
MMEPPSSRVFSRVADAALSSRLNCALGPEEVVALLGGEARRLIPFDNCTLILRSPGGDDLCLWQTSKHPGLETTASIESFDQRHGWFHGEIRERAPRLLDPESLKYLGEDLESALMLPLSVGGKRFGLLSFASGEPDTYTSRDIMRLMWLADHVAAVTRVSQLERLEKTSVPDREIERLKSGFINTLVRDIRLPLSGVVSALELLHEKLQARDQFDSSDRQLLNIGLEHGDRICHLVDDLLEVARQDDRPLTLDLEIVEVTRLVELAAEPVRGEAALRGVGLDILALAATTLLAIDLKQTRRALTHLLTAALAATPDGGTVSITSSGITSTQGPHECLPFVVLNISDSGDGIPPEQVPFIFDAFWQAAESRTAAGRSVGLSIAKRIARAHGGNVAVTSQPEKGTVYSIMLPAVEPGAESDSPGFRN